MINMKLHFTSASTRQEVIYYLHNADLVDLIRKGIEGCDLTKVTLQDVYDAVSRSYIFLLEHDRELSDKGFSMVNLINKEEFKHELFKEVACEYLHSLVRTVELWEENYGRIRKSI
jgi:hypothetical protein